MLFLVYLMFWKSDYFQNWGSFTFLMIQLVLILLMLNMKLRGPFELVQFVYLFLLDT